jgi:hypothetical protein
MVQDADAAGLQRILILEEDVMFFKHAVGEGGAAGAAGAGGGWTGKDLTALTKFIKSSAEFEQVCRRMYCRESTHSGSLSSTFMPSTQWAHTNERLP